MDLNGLSFDPRHPWFPVPGQVGAEWALEVFTVDDALGVDPQEATFVNGHLRASRLQWLGGQRSVLGRVDADVRLRDGAVVWRVTAETHGLVKAIKLLVRGISPQSWQSGWWTPTTPAGQTLVAQPGLPVQLTYPWPSWETAWAAAGDGPVTLVSVRDSKVRPKRLYASHPHWSKSPVLEIVCDQAADARSFQFEAPEIRLRECASLDEAHADFQQHLAALEADFGLVPWDQRRDVPPWARNLDLVVTLHGQHWTGFVFNTFDRMAEILEQVTEDISGDRILAYLPGWEGRYYWQYPLYSPGEDLGGHNGFARLVATARRLGVHLMPMFGANGANVRRYPRWKEAAFRSPSNNYVALINAPDWDNDRAPEDDQVFLNPGEPEFQRHLLEQISDLVERYSLEGIFLDTSACWFNDPRFDVYEGYVRLVGLIRERHPQILVCGEGWYDALLSVFPMNQTWQDDPRPPRFDDLPVRYARTLGHLKDGAPGDGSTGVHEGGTRAIAAPLRIPGHIPALPIVDDTASDHRDAIRDFIRAVAKEAL